MLKFYNIPVFEMIVSPISALDSFLKGDAILGLTNERAMAAKFLEHEERNSFCKKSFGKFS